MRQDEMPSPGLIPNAHRLCTEVARAINYAETQRELRGEPSETGGDLASFFEKLLAHMKSQDLIPAPQTKKGK